MRACVCVDTLTVAGADSVMQIRHVHVCTCVYADPDRTSSQFQSRLETYHCKEEGNHS